MTKFIKKQLYSEINELFEYLDRCIMVHNFETGYSSSIPSKFVKHEHKLYSIKHKGKKFRLMVEVDGEIEDSNG
jgi:hypothetical protein